MNDWNWSLLSDDIKHKKGRQWIDWDNLIIILSIVKYAFIFLKSAAELVAPIVRAAMEVQDMPSILKNIRSANCRRCEVCIAARDRILEQNTWWRSLSHFFFLFLWDLVVLSSCYTNKKMCFITLFFLYFFEVCIVITAPRKTIPACIAVWYWFVKQGKHSKKGISIESETNFKLWVKFF